jgi:hypothetical protein
MPQNADNARGVQIIKAVLVASEPRPDRSAKAALKTQYAVRFAEKMAELIADDLRPKMAGIKATTKREAGSVSGTKQLDINFSTPQLGLALGISLKSVHIRESTGAERYTHNMKRNEEELRIEASGYHKRQPYAVMIGVLFLPFDSCDDARIEGSSSSFGSWVRKLRPYSGRLEPDDEVDRFEKLFIGLYESDGGDLCFFDIDSDPPRQGRPRRLLSYEEFLDASYHAYLRRNHADFRWADGSEEPLGVDEIQRDASSE